MIESIIGLIALFVALTVLLLNLNIESGWSWRVKAGAIVATMLSVATAYFAVVGLLGWPTRESIPDNVKMLFADVVEPQKGADDEGAIYLWVKPIGRSKAQPRAYELPYDPEFHEMVIAAMERAGNGIQQGVRLNPDHYKTTPSWGAGLPLNFFDIKPLQLPEKTNRRSEE